MPIFFAGGYYSHIHIIVHSTSTYITCWLAGVAAKKTSTTNYTIYMIYSVLSSASGSTRIWDRERRQVNGRSNGGNGHANIKQMSL